MPDAHKRLLNELLALPYYERAAFADALLDSLARAPRPETEARYEDEVAREMDEFEAAA